MKVKDKQVGCEEGSGARGTGILPVTGHGQDGHATKRRGTISIRHGAYLPHWTSEDATYAVTFRLADSLPKAVVESWEFERRDIVKTAQQMNRPLTPAEETRLDSLFSDRVEKFLDACAGECWMRRDDVAGVVASALQHFDAARGTGILPVTGHGQDGHATRGGGTGILPVTGHGQDGHPTRGGGTGILPVTGHGQDGHPIGRYRLFAWCVMPNHVHTVVQPLPGYELAGIVHSWKSFTANESNRLIGRTGQFWQPEPYDHLIRDEDDFRSQVEYVLSNPVRAGLKNWKWVGRGAG